MLRPPCSFSPALPFALIVALTLGIPAAAQTSAAPPQRGVVVDTQDAVVVRAHVRVVDPNGAVIGAALTDERGRFQIATPTRDCRIQVTLTGFRPAAAPCAAPDVRVVLAPAPVSESIVVSATRDAAPTSQIGSAVTVFTADDIERRGTPAVADLLRATPGITVARTGGAGGQTSLFARGGESSYNKVLLDGIPLNEPGGTFNFGNLTTEQIERVEVVRGAESALFGSDAMSSVIHLFTRQARTPGAHGALAAELGSHEWLRGSASLSTRRGGWDLAVTAARAQTENHVPNNAFENTTAAWNAGGPLAGRAVLRSTGRVESQHSGTPGATAFGRPDLDAFFDRRDVVGGIAGHVDTGAVTQRISYAYSRSRQTSRNLVEDAPFTPRFGDRVGQFEFFDFLFDSDNRLERHHASYQADWRPGGAAAFGSHFFTAAIDWDGERARLDNRMTAVRIPAARDNVGATVQYQLVASRLSVVTGLRVERNDAFGTAVVPRLTAAAELRRGAGAIGQTILNATAGAGVKEPTILQSHSPSSFFLGNPDLEPERSRAVSIGVEQRLAGDRVKVEAIWFDHRYRDQISTRTISLSPFVSQYFNIGRTQARGLELGATVAPAAVMRARGGYTLLDSEIVESTAPLNPLFQAGQQAFRRPRHSGFAEIGWTRGPVDVSVYGVFAGARVDSDFAELVPPMTEAPAYALWTAAARYRIGARVDWSLRVENLTDTDYMEPLGFPAWGRTVQTAIRVRF
jgi:vitamin B12 transporter